MHECNTSYSFSKWWLALPYRLLLYTHRSYGNTLPAWYMEQSTTIRFMHSLPSCIILPQFCNDNHYWLQLSIRVLLPYWYHLSNSLPNRHIQ